MRCLPWSSSACLLISGRHWYLRSDAWMHHLRVGSAALLGCLLPTLNMLKMSLLPHAGWDLFGPSYELMIIATFVKTYLVIVEYAAFWCWMIMENLFSLLSNSHAFVDLKFQFDMFWWVSLERLVLFTLATAETIWSFVIDLFYLINVKYFHVSSFVFGLLFISKSFLEYWFSRLNIFSGLWDSSSCWLEILADLYLTVMSSAGSSPVLGTSICLK